jgi:membrane protein DedA with SNARE-associated domain
MLVRAADLGQNATRGNQGPIPRLAELAKAKQSALRQAARHFAPVDRVRSCENGRRDGRVGEDRGAIVVSGVSLHAFAFSFGWSLSDAAQLFSLVALPFAHADLAIVYGAYFIVNKLLPAVAVVLCIYVGMVASDLALYGVGAAARHIPWLSRYAVDGRVRRFGQMLRRNLFGLFALCCMVPGVPFVAFVACGWLRVPLKRFTAASLLVSALYLPIVLYLAIVFGDALDDHVGLWSWPFILIALIASAYVRRRVFAFGRTEEATEMIPVPGARLEGGGGMLVLSRRNRDLALAIGYPPGAAAHPHKI